MAALGGGGRAPLVPAFVAQGPFAQVQRLAVRAGVVGDVVDAGVGELGDEVAAAQFHGVDAQFPGGPFEEPLHHHHVLGAADAPVGGGGGLVGGDGAGADPVGGHLVDAGHLGGGHQGLDAGGEGVAGVGAHVADDVGVEGEYASVGVEGGAGVVVLFAGEEGGGERVLAVLGPFDGSVQSQGRRGGGDLLAADDALLAEAAAHVGDDDAHGPFVQPQAAGRHRPYLVRGLTGRLEEQLLLAVVPVGDGAAGLQGQCVLAAGAGIDGDDAGGRVEDRVDALGREHRDVDEGVGRRVVVHEGRAGGEGVGFADDGRAGVVRHLRGLQAVLGSVRVAGHDDGQWLARVAHPVPGEYGHVGGDVLRAGAVQAGRDVAEVEVGGGERRDDARDLTHVVEVDGGDGGVGHGAADELGVQHAGQVDVVGEPAAPGEQPGILAAAYGRADPGAVGGGDFVTRGGHRAIASSQARVTRVRVRALR